jgi:hypothetical protein
MSKTVFFPGRAVTVKWLNSSQYLGPSNPGVVFVANPINDYEYPLLKASSFDLPDIFGYFVGTTSDQTVNGEKSFLISPKVPTATNSSGTQVVNIDRLNSDIALNNAAFNLAINNTNTNLSNLSNSIAANYVGLAGTQTITGNKTFNTINVPITPAAGTSPVSLNYFDSNVVSLNNDQTVNGTKTFSASPQVPTPDSGNDAVNYQTLLNAVSGLINPNVSGGCIKLGPIQIVFGFFQVTGDWQAGGEVTGSVNYSGVAPNMSPFTSISGASSDVDRLVITRVSYSNTTISWAGDSPGGNISQPPNGIVRFIVIGYTN